ncbi:MAG: hypothetical protein M1825_000130 [Sarcosagium campestre]|nr:MAG: hypothetical protein M1825_000130 [Sarcosagium campestre]
MGLPNRGGGVGMDAGRKVKCGEEKPECLNCVRQGEKCDYSIRLNWEGRGKKRGNDSAGGFINFTGGPKSAGLPSASSFGNNVSERASSEAPLNEGPSKHRKRQTKSPPDASPRFRSASPDYGIPDITGDASGATFQTWLSAPPRGAEEIPQTAPPRLAQFPDAAKAVMESGQAPLSNTEDIKREIPDSWQSNSATPLSQSHDFRFSPSASQSDYFSPSQDGFGNSGQNGQDLGASQYYTSRASSGATQMSPSLQSHMRTRSSPWVPRAAPSSIGQRTKRLRLNDDQDLPFAQQTHFMRPPAGLALPTAPSTSGSLLSFSPVMQNTSAQYGLHAASSTTPMTPGNSSVTSDDLLQQVAPRGSPHVSVTSPRRLSVNSLLSGPTNDAFGDVASVEAYSHRSQSNSAFPSGDGYDAAENTVSYGLDRGYPDLDSGKNNDSLAISAVTSVTPEAFPFEVNPFAADFLGDDGSVRIEFGFGVPSKDAAFNEGGYYAQPVPVKIPASFHPLPPSLTDNQMNLLYFHHFLNHTARILVPHDCSQNPFKSILPQMAVQDSNLLNLLLAYSASHRARLLNHAEPVNRIAHWVKDVFSNLYLALNDSQAKISDSNLATTIMLASLEIISPNTFEVPIPWQTHLDMARQMIIARGGPQAVHKGDKVSYFLSRWFAYLDVLGSLSGGKNDKPLFSGHYWGTDELDEENGYEIDCLLGFTSRCVSILAQIAELARRCDGERITPNGEVRPGWKPSIDVVTKANRLRDDLQESRTHEYRGCNHRGSGAENEHGWDSLEMIATNEAFHWAGLVHLDRRVMGKPSTDAEVQNAVREIVGALYKVRKGGTAEACLLFPMFTAGCDARSPEQREKIMDRIKSVEQSGMTQVHRARTLMQQVWDTGRPWETLVNGEFFG